MSTALAVASSDAISIEGLEKTLISGDLRGLTEAQRITYYKRVCESVGLNPLTQPFEYIILQNKMVLYARRACTDQLRHIHHVSISIVSRETVSGIYVVTARAQLPSGRCDESIGAVPVEGLKGENLSNALMKAETKAKRRVTLAICGLSMLDELEVESIPQTAAKPSGVRTLDHVALAAPSPVVEGELEPEAPPAPVDEYGITIPASPCPRFSSQAKTYKGQLWTEVPSGFIRELAEKNGDRMSTVQVEWATYILARRQAEKSHAEQAERAVAAQTGENV